MVHVMGVEYLGIARVAMARIPVGDNALRVTESLLSLLKAGGVEDQAAAYAADLVSMFVTAIAYELEPLRPALCRSRARDAGGRAPRPALRGVSSERYPTIAALRDKLTSGDGEERFSLGLDVIVNGLLQTPTDGRMTSAPWERKS
jgi:hypothetical protein